MDDVANGRIGWFVFLFGMTLILAWLAPEIKRVI